MLIHTEEYEGFDIHFYALAEESSFSDWFEGQDDVADDIASGRLSWFTAKVQAFKNGIPLASAHLACCAYKNASEFVTQEGCYADMRATVVRESRKMIADTYSMHKASIVFERVE